MNESLLPALLQAMEAGEAVALVTVVSEGPRRGDQCLAWLEAAKSCQGPLRLEPETLDAVREAIRMRAHRRIRQGAEEGACELFVEVHGRPPHLFIVGAGHIAVPLATMGFLCDFSVTVLDDRTQYAHAARFPHADRVLAADFLPSIRALRAEGRLDEQTYVALVTRGHQYDVDCLTEMLDDDLPYIGMIGSQRRIRAVFELLQTERGIPKAQFARVHAPIGLDIGARTPAEIAVCIMAEIISVRQGKSGPSR